MRVRRTGLALGWRWFWRASGSGRRLRRDRIIASALAVLVAVLAMSLWQANSSRQQRERAQEPRPAAGAVASFRAYQVDAPAGSDVWSTVFVAASDRGTAPSPPGVPRFPGPDETWVSPAVASEIRHHPDAAARVPGHVVGIIGQAGLQSPDQLFVYAGARAGRSWWPADGWGAPAAAVARPAIPRLPFLGLVAVLLGLPCLLLARSVARMSADSRGRSLAAAHLMGVPARTLALASAVDGLCCALTGSALGTTAAVVTVSVVHAHTWWGIAWFTPPTIVPMPTTLALVTAIATGITWRSWRESFTGLDDVLAARAGEPRQRPWWRVAPLIIGVAALAGVVLPAYVAGHQTSPVLCLWYLGCGGALAVFGAFIALPQILRGSARWWQRSARSATTRLATRRLWWESDMIATSSAAIMVMAVSAVFGAGAVADLDAISPPSAAGDTYSFQSEDASSLSRVLAVPGVRILQVDHGSRTLDVAPCDMLARVVATAAPGSVDEFLAQCRPGARFRVVSVGAPSPTRIVLPGLQDSVLLDARILAADPMRLPPSHRQQSVLAWPGGSDRDVDRYVTGVLAAAHQTQVTDLSADSFEPMIAPTRRLLLVSTAGGLVIGVCLLLVTSLDTVGRTRTQQARLAVLGASRRVSVRAHTFAFGLGAGVALAIGLVIGGLMATVYDLTGGLVCGPGGLGWTVALLASAATGCGILLASWAAHRDGGEPITELVRRE